MKWPCIVALYAVLGCGGALGATIPDLSIVGSGDSLTPLVDTELTGTGLITGDGATDGVLTVDGVEVTNSGDLTIEGDGASSGVLDVINGGEFVSNGSIVVNDGGKIGVSAGGASAFDSHGDLQINDGGVLQVDDGAASVLGTTEFNDGSTVNVDGGRFYATGTTTFADGSQLVVQQPQAPGAAVVFDNEVVFEEGSSFTNGTGGVVNVVSNQGNLRIHTGMKAGEATALINATSMSGTTSHMFLYGSAADIGNTLDYTGASTIGPKVYIATNAGDTYTTLKVGNAELHIKSNTIVSGDAQGSGYIQIGGADPVMGAGDFNTTVTFRGQVDVAVGVAGAQALQVAGGSKAVFDGAAANFATGNIVNQGTIDFTNGATLSSAGTVSNSNIMNLDASTVYTGTGIITNQTNGVINVSSNMADLDDFFANTTLQNGSELHLTDVATGAPDLDLGAAAGNSVLGSKVFVDAGGSFAGLDVNNASLVINGSANATTFSGDVVANDITVNQSRQTTFQADVKGDLTVVTSAVLDTGATFGGPADLYSIFVKNTTSTLTNKGAVYIGNGEILENNGTTANDGTIQIAAGGTLHNKGQGSVLTNSAGSTITNDGALTNEGLFTNNGTYQGVGTFTNEHQFVNSGTFRNQTTVPGAITNTADGVMQFNVGTTYQQSTTNSYIHNYGTVNAFAFMNRTSLEGLFADMSMQAGSEFFLVAQGTGSLNGNFVFGQTVAGSDLNIDFGANTVTFGDTVANSVIDAKLSDINFQKGTIVMKDGASVVTQSEFTAGQNTTFTFGDTVLTSLEAENAVFSSNAKITVVENGLGEITITGGGVADALHLQDTASITIAKNGSLNVTGNTDFGSGTSVSLGEMGRMTSTGDMHFAGNTAITITATPGGVSQIVADGAVTIDSGKTTVNFIGDRQDFVGPDGGGNYRIFLASDTSTVQYENLYNALYKFSVDNTWNGGAGQGVYVSGLRSVLDGMANAFGGWDAISINKINGGEYTDKVLDTAWGQGNTDLTDYLQIAGDPALGFDKSFNAYSQLFGEYAAYSSTSMLTATNNFKSILRSRMNHTRVTRVEDCDVCHGIVMEDPCNACATVEYTTYASGGANGSGIWASPFGDWGKQKGKRYINGYDYSSIGIAGGWDRTMDNLTIGVSAAYTNGSLKVKSQDAKFNTDALNLALYGTWAHESNVYVSGQLGYGYGWNDYDVSMVLGGSKEGEYKNHTYTAALELGYHAALADNMNIIPYVGLEYVHVSQKGWTEDITRGGGAPILANNFDKLRYNSVEIPVGVTLNKVIDMGEMRLVPEVRAAYVYEANDRRPIIRSAYAGAGSGYATLYGADSGASRGVVGAGMKILYANNFALGVDYNLDFKGGYREHNLTGTLSLDF